MSKRKLLPPVELLPPAEMAAKYKCIYQAYFKSGLSEKLIAKVSLREAVEAFRNRCDRCCTCMND